MNFDSTKLHNLLKQVQPTATETNSPTKRLRESVEFDSCSQLLASFFSNLALVREDLENTKGTDDIDDALDYFDSIVKQFHAARIKQQKT